MKESILKIVTFFVATFLHFVLYSQTHRHVLDDRIDSLQILISKARPDTSKVDLYLELITNYHDRYRLRGAHSADSLAFLQNLEACRSLSKKIHFAYGEGTCMLKEARMHAALRNIPARDERLQLAISIFNTARNKKGLAYAFLSKSSFQPNDLPVKIRYCDTALQLARQCGDPKLEALALKSRADLHWQKMEYTTAIQELSTALELQKRSGDNRLHSTTDLLTVVYTTIGKYKEALEYAIATLNYSRKVNDTIYITTYYQRLGLLYINLGNHKEAYYYFNRALSSMAISMYTRDVAIALLSKMSDCLIAQGNAREALYFFSGELKKYPPVSVNSQYFVDMFFVTLYRSVNNFKEAEKYLLKALNPDKGVSKSLIDVLHEYTNGAKIYYELKQYDKASWYADTAYALARQTGSRGHLTEISMTLHQLELIKGNYKTALQHFREYKDYNDSFNQKMADKRLIELSVKYETDQKNSQLQFLTTEARLHKEAIEQGKMLRNFMIAASVLLSLLLGLIFNRYRVKQQANKLLHEKQNEIHRQNQALEKMLAEKEWLMKEINHRVKNNLQVVMSLLNTQSAYLKDESALNAIQESRHRVHAIALIHRKLYQSEQQLTTIDMAAYIKEITDYLADSLDPHNRIRFGLLIDPIELDVTQAVPTGLIINEAVTNAVKYAFPKDRKGQIDISMTKNATGAIELTIQDNGIGLPAGFNWQQTDSLGMSLMQGLSTQLDGNFDVLQQDGLTIKISFQPAKVLNT